MFISSVFALFLSHDIDWITLKIIVFTFLCLIVMMLTFIWFRFLKIYQKRPGRTLRMLFCQWNLVQEKSNRLKQSTLALYMLATQKHSLQDILIKFNITFSLFFRIGFPVFHRGNHYRFL